MRPRVLITFKMKRKPVEELKKYADVDFLLYPSVEELTEKVKDYDGLIVSPP